MIYIVVLIALFAVAMPTVSICAAQPQMEKARARLDDLRLEAYATSRQVEQLSQQEAFRERAWSAIQKLGITKVYLEIYRGGHVVSREDLVSVRDWLQDRNIDIVSGIATVPGGAMLPTSRSISRVL